MGVALGILGSTYFEMGEVSKACELLASSVTINKTIYGQKHVDTAIVETQLGNALRLVHIYMYIEIIVIAHCT